MMHARLALFSVCMAMSTHAIANLPPVIDPIPSQRVAEGQTLTFSVTATDPEGTAVTTTAKGLKTWMSFSKGVFTAKPGLTHAGNYQVSFTAKDATGRASTLSVPIQVDNTNQAPVLGTLINRSVSEGGSLTFTVSATDPDKDVVSISAAPLLPWMSFDGSRFTATPGFADSGVYKVTFSASDGKLSSQAVQTLTVLDVNQLPVFAPLENLTVAEGGALKKAVSAHDPNGGAVTITATGLQNAWMSFDGANLTLTPGFGQAGYYEVTFVASDAVSQSKSTLGITVSKTNRAPELSALGEWHVGAGHSLSFPVTASDADNDTLSLFASGLQHWMSFDGKSFRAYPTEGNVGSHLVTITASDGQASVSLPVTIHVTEDGQAFPPPWTAYVGSQWTGTSWSGLERSWLGYLTGINLVNSPGKIGDLVQQVGDRIVNHDVIVTIEGFGGDGDGTSSSEIAPVIDLMHGGGLATWQEAVMLQVEALSPLDPEARRLYYQLGNEITKQKNSDTIRAWAASRGIVIPGASRDNDREMIPYYVEYYLAPTLEAMAIASERAYGDPNKVNITLGSIGNGGTADARAYLDALLNYRVQGQYAPSLAGKQVYELVDLLTVHYPGATSNLDPIIDQWMGQGAVRGLWTTEVVGINAAEAGKGAGTAAWELNNYLMWTYERGLTPEQARYSIYGWDVSGSASNAAVDRFMQDFLGFFGNVALEARRNDVQLTGDASMLQATLFMSLADQASRAVSVTTTSQLAQNSLLSSVTVDKSGWTGAVSATVYHYTTSGLRISTASVFEGSDHYSVTLSPSVSLTGGGDAVLITLKRK